MSDSLVDRLSGWLFSVAEGYEVLAMMMMMIMMMFGKSQFFGFVIFEGAQRSCFTLGSWDFRYFGIPVLWRWYRGVFGVRLTLMVSRRGYGRQR